MAAWQFTRNQEIATEQETTVMFTLTRINFCNEESFWTAGRAEFQLDEYSSLVTYGISGIIPLAEVGKKYRAKGMFSVHPKYGTQFTITKKTSAEEILPVTEEELLAYLSSGIIQGVGKAYAKRIVNRFGVLTPKIIEQTPDRLREVPGIGKKRAKRIADSWNASKEIQALAQLLTPYSVTMNKIILIYRHFGNQATAIVRKNPYRLVEIRGIGFKTADALAQKFGVSPKSPSRVKAGTFYVLEEQEHKGNTCIPKEEFTREMEELLNLPLNIMQPVWKAMTLPKDEWSAPQIYLNQNMVYSRSLYQAEVNVAKRLLEINQTNSYRPNSEVFPQELSRIEQKTLGPGQSFAPEQKAAIRQACNNKILILTGGPGTGKTTVIKGIVKAWERRHEQIRLAAPTGRAAQKMTESIGDSNYQATTIHALLEWRDGTFQRKTDNPLEETALIIDETSMLDIRLMSALLSAVPDNMRLVFVGDVDQLPSVGAGSVLKDLIDSRQFPVVRLKLVQRQGKNSGIHQNAQRIRNGKLPEFQDWQGNRYPDFRFLNTAELDSEATALKTQQTITQIMTQILPVNGWKLSDIQILSPMHKGLSGTDALNLAIKESLKKGEVVPVTYQMTKNGKKTFPRFTIEPGDRVMQTRNVSSLQVYNGDIGIVQKLNPEMEEEEDSEDILIHYPSVAGTDRNIVYDKLHQIDLVPAYAITIHKSQGSEFPVVLVPLLRSMNIMLQRNLIYTAVTRAKKALILVGEWEAVRRAVFRNSQSKRCGLLQERLNQMQSNSLFWFVDVEDTGKSSCSLPGSSKNILPQLP